MVTARARALAMACVGGSGRPGRASVGDLLRCSAREGERKREASPRQRHFWLRLASGRDGLSRAPVPRFCHARNDPTYQRHTGTLHSGIRIGHARPQILVSSAETATHGPHMVQLSFTPSPPQHLPLSCPAPCLVRVGPSTRRPRACRRCRAARQARLPPRSQRRARPGLGPPRGP